MRAALSFFPVDRNRRVPDRARRSAVTAILDRRSTTSAVAGSHTHTDVVVATGLLVDPDFGTNTGIPTARRLRPVALVITGVPSAVVTDLSGDDPAPRCAPSVTELLRTGSQSRRSREPSVSTDARSPAMPGEISGLPAGGLGFCTLLPSSSRRSLPSVPDGSAISCWRDVAAWPSSTSWAPQGGPSSGPGRRGWLAARPQSL